MEINNYKLKLYSHVKYLEILIDKVLSWIKQIESICAKLAKSNGILSKLRHFVPKDICISVYHSLFYNHLFYGYLVWSNSRKSNIDRTIKLQRSYIRIINFPDFNFRTDPLFSGLKLLKVNDVFSLSKLLFFLCSIL